jgi:3-dehydroquinate dehydratase / shikimate dehydrogenase
MSVICLTGRETRITELALRLDRYAQLPLQEVRLDYLTDLNDSVYPLLRSPHLVVTCRSHHEGGHFTGSETERAQVLRRALAQQPGYLDVELSTDPQQRLVLYQQRGATRIIASWHQVSAGSDPQGPLAELAQEPAQLLKVATMMQDAAEIQHLLQVLPHQDRPVLRIGLGPAGLLSRALYGRCGSPWTYVALGEQERTAAGQLTLEVARAWRIDQQERLALLALLGGSQVVRSWGPLVYNRLFAARDNPFLYLPVVTTQPQRALDLLRQLGCVGVSVTMPAKEALLGRMDELRDDAEAIGAINTVLLRGDRLIGLNTDAGAIAELLAPYAAKPALVLGTGGASRAAIWALRQLRCPVTVTGRTGAHAQRLAAATQVATIPWGSREEQNFSLLVNATPCGSDGQSSPMPNNMDWTQRVVLELVAVPEQTPLLAQVARGGGKGISGKTMWLHQGARQIAALTGLPCTPRELSGYA